MSVVIAAFGGPGIGKSVLAATLFSKLKKMGRSTEYVSEYAKELAWENNKVQLEDQLFITAKQNQRQWRLKKAGVDFIVTDSPLLLGLQYKAPDYFPNYFEDMVKEVFLSYNNVNILLKRPERAFEDHGRIHNEEESKEIDKKIKKMLDEYELEYLEVEANDDAADIILNYALEREKDFLTHNIKEM